MLGNPLLGHILGLKEQYMYHIVGNFGKVFNLVIWQIF